MTKAQDDGVTEDIEFVRDVLSSVLTETIGVTGALIATVDGLLIAAESDEMEVDAVAALAAAAAGVGAQFTQLLGLGAPNGSVMLGSKGSVAVRHVGRGALLVMFGTDGPNLARLHLAMRQVMPRLEEAVAKYEST
jgi:uncharacterized protein